MTDTDELNTRLEIALDEAKELVERITHADPKPSVLATLAAGLELVRLAAYSAEHHGAGTEEELLMWAAAILQDQSGVTVSPEMYLKLSSDSWGSN